IRATRSPSSADVSGRSVRWYSSCCQAADPVVTASMRWSVSPTPTFTPRPPFLAPSLLLPADGTLVEGDQSSVLLSWSATAPLGSNTFYVLYLTDDSNRLTTHWTRATSYRLPPDMRPRRLTTYSWYVVVMEKTGVGKGGIAKGKALSSAGPARTFQWR
ncbi:MAG: hypothetical protein ACE5G8_10770, partial [Anaerolineae bacterium]